MILTLCVLTLAFLLLLREWVAPDIAIFGALVVLWAAGIINTEQALQGFSNPQVLTIGLLFVIAAAVQSSGVLERFTHALLGAGTDSRGRPTTTRNMARLIAPVALLSAFMNNTPIVAMLTPVVRDWARDRGQAPSRYLIPLSYAAIVGGTCTLIGTSTNLVVSGLLEASGQAPLSMLELTVVGLPATAICLLFLLFVSPKILPVRRAPIDPHDPAGKRYSVRVGIAHSSPLIGKTIEEANLRQLRGLFLSEIIRDGQRILPVRPTDLLEGGDQLILVGDMGTVAEVLDMPGVMSVNTRQERASQPQAPQILREIILPKSSAFVGKNLRQLNFRRRYDAAVMSIHRQGERLEQKLGDVVLKAGDTLLLATSRKFTATWADSRDFYIFTPQRLTPAPKIPLWRTITTVSILLLTIFFLVAQLLPIALTVSIAAVTLVALRCIDANKARQSINLSVLLLIASSFGLSAAVQSSGLASAIGNLASSILGEAPAWVALVFIYALCALITETLSNNAAAAIVFPVAISTASALGVDARPFAVAVTFAASMSFMTPLGYQTNLLVYGPGGYRFTDFLRVGTPLSLLMGTTCILLIPYFWPF